MIPAPATGNVYDLVPPGSPNPGQQGAAVAWSFVQDFYLNAAPEAWFDMETIKHIGPGD